LAEIFGGCTLYFRGITDPLELKKLSRYVIAYDGDVDKKVTSHTTHVVIGDGKPDDNLPTSGNNVDIKLVQKDWVMACVEAGRRLDEKAFLVVT